MSPALIGPPAAVPADSRRPPQPAATTKDPSCRFLLPFGEFVQVAGGLLGAPRHSHDRVRHDPGLRLRFRLVLLLDRFPDSRHRLHPVAGIEAGRIDGMAVPGTAGDARGVTEIAFREVDRTIDRL